MFVPLFGTGIVYIHNRGKIKTSPTYKIAKNFRIQDRSVIHGGRELSEYNKTILCPTFCTQLKGTVHRFLHGGVDGSVPPLEIRVTAFSILFDFCEKI